MAKLATAQPSDTETTAFQWMGRLTGLAAIPAHDGTFGLAKASEVLAVEHFAPELAAGALVAAVGAGVPGPVGTAVLASSGSSISRHLRQGRGAGQTSDVRAHATMGRPGAGPPRDLMMPEQQVDEIALLAPSSHRTPSSRRGKPGPASVG